MRAVLPCWVVLTACATSQAVPGDAAGGDDTAQPDGAIDAAGADAPTSIDAGIDASAGPYRHAITIDGTNDFAAADTFTTTSAPAYVGYVSWDDTNLYVGYRGPDLDAAAPDAGYKWLFVHLDTDPGASTGAAHSLTYNTQRATFPTGFGPEYYYRWKCDGSFATLEQFQSPGWATSATTIAVARTGDFVELALPRALFGGAPVVGVATWMINEKPGVEASYAGLYDTNFSDGYAANLALTRYLAADFASPAPPTDPSHGAP